MAETPAHLASHPLPSGERLIVTVGVMMAVLLQVLDTTIANVALPHMAGSVSATLRKLPCTLAISRSTPSRPTSSTPPAKAASTVVSTL